MYKCQDGRVVKALDLRSNGHLHAWVRILLLIKYLFKLGNVDGNNIYKTYKFKKLKSILFKIHMVKYQNYLQAHAYHTLLGNLLFHS